MPGWWAYRATVLRVCSTASRYNFSRVWEHFFNCTWPSCKIADRRVSFGHAKGLGVDLLWLIVNAMLPSHVVVVVDVAFVFCFLLLCRWPWQRLWLCNWILYESMCALRMPGPRAITHDRHTQQARGAARAVRGAHALSSRVLRGYVVVIEVLNFSAQDVVLRCFKYLNAIREYIIGFLYAISDELLL